MLALNQGEKRIEYLKVVSIKTKLTYIFQGISTFIKMDMSPYYI